MSWRNPGLTLGWPRSPTEGTQERVSLAVPISRPNSHAVMMEEIAATSFASHEALSFYHHHQAYRALSIVFPELKRSNDQRLLITLWFMHLPRRYFVETRMRSCRRRRRRSSYFGRNPFIKEFIFRFVQISFLASSDSFFAPFFPATQQLFNLNESD